MQLLRTGDTWKPRAPLARGGVGALRTLADVERFSSACGDGVKLLSPLPGWGESAGNLRRRDTRPKNGSTVQPCSAVTNERTGRRSLHAESPTGYSSPDRTCDLKARATGRWGEGAIKRHGEKAMGRSGDEVIGQWDKRMELNPPTWQRAGFSTAAHERCAHTTYRQASERSVERQVVTGCGGAGLGCVFTTPLAC
jgi:hypothetical protein